GRKASHMPVKIWSSVVSTPVTSTPLVISSSERPSSIAASSWRRASADAWSAMVSVLLSGVGAAFGLLPRARHEVDHHSGQRFPAVLLQEVPAARQGRVRLTGGAGNGLLEDAVEALRDRVAVAEGGEERLPPATERVPRGAVGRRRRVVGRVRHE